MIHNAPSFWRQTSLAESLDSFGTGTTSHGFAAELYLGMLSLALGSMNIYE
jgi:hypothetical protein|tara:strand:- start:695 stop:847 length:153 start_codon:yes stop_codon:yes gene_type:complete